MITSGRPENDLKGVIPFDSGLFFSGFCAFHHQLLIAVGGIRFSSKNIILKNDQHNFGRGVNQTAWHQMTAIRFSCGIGHREMEMTAIRTQRSAQAQNLKFAHNFG